MVFVRPVQARPRQQPRFASVEAGVHAISVVLDLMQPFWALGVGVYQFAKLWLEPSGKTGRAVPRPIYRRSRHHGFAIGTRQIRSFKNPKGSRWRYLTDSLK